MNEAEIAKVQKKLTAAKRLLKLRVNPETVNLDYLNDIDNQMDNLENELKELRAIRKAVVGYLGDAITVNDDGEIVEIEECEEVIRV